MDKAKEKQLMLIAAKARKFCIEAVYTAASGHPGGSFSCIDALTELYFDEMNIDPANPAWEDRDRFVLSKGHCSPGLYAVLALRGYFPTEDMKLFRSIKGHYSGHPDMQYVPGVDMSTGSLGQGLSVAVGMALSARLAGKSWRTYAICGDGEIEEGQIWEAAMSAAKWKLDNLCAFVDVNGLQIDGATADVMPSEPLDKKFEAFNWNVIHVCGHDYDALEQAFADAAACKGKPTVLLLKTTKGKGVSFMENQCSWHGKAPNEEQYKEAMSELEARIKELEVL